MAYFARLCLITMLLQAFASPIKADDDVRSLAERLVELARLDQITEQMAQSFATNYKSVFRNQMKENSPDISDEHLDAIIQIMDEELVFAMAEVAEPMGEFLIDFYMDNYTRDEISTMVEMYSSPLMQKNFDLMPKMMQEASEFGVPIQNEMMARLTRRLQERMSRGQ